MKKLLAFILLISFLSPAFALTGPIPKKFQGTWIDSSPIMVKSGMSVYKINPTSIDISNGYHPSIISFEPYNEEGTKLDVKYQSPPRPDGNHSIIEMIWYLTKINGQEVLIEVDVNSPETIFIYHR